MKKDFLLTASILMVFVGGLPAAAPSSPIPRVEVTFISPEKFTDFSDEAHESERARERLQATLQDEITSLATRYLSAGQHLAIKVTDVDLAGGFEPWLGFEYYDVRIVREIYPPRISLEFRLTGPDGLVVREGSRQLQDLGFMMSVSIPSSDALRCEKRMLQDWFRQEFKAGT